MPKPFDSSDTVLAFPAIRLELVEDLSPPAGEGYLRLVRRRFRAVYPDGSRSDPFLYDETDRRQLDATVIAAHFVDAEGVRHVYLRSALRPPVYMRDPNRDPRPFPERGGGLWELPAGLVEVAEQTPQGLYESARRELREEVGFDVPVKSLRELGPSTYPAPGVIAERHFYFEVVVDPVEQAEPGLDGSALEKFGIVWCLPLLSALELCRRGEIEDAKTELALRRLAERYA
jgi:ADP-ribose pyrophosphatase